MADHDHRLDSRLDAIALYRAVLAADTEGGAVIIDNTPCRDCLAIGAVLAGITLAARDDDDNITSGPDGRPVFSDRLLADLHECLSQMRAADLEDGLR
jgi:hypothetical protein